MAQIGPTHNSRSIYICGLGNKRSRSTKFRTVGTPPCQPRPRERKIPIHDWKALLHSLLVSCSLRNDRSRSTTDRLLWFLLMIKLTRCRLSIWVSKFRSSSDFSLLNWNKTWALEIWHSAWWFLWYEFQQESTLSATHLNGRGQTSLSQIKQLFLAELAGTAQNRKVCISTYVDFS